MNMREIPDGEEEEEWGGEALRKEAMRGGASGRGGRGEDPVDEDGEDEDLAEARRANAPRGGASGHGGGDEKLVDEDDAEDWDEARRGGASGHVGGGEARRGGPSGHGGRDEKLVDEDDAEGWDEARRGGASGHVGGGGGWRDFAHRNLVKFGARVALYPTLAYNLARNKVDPEFHWWDCVDEYVLLGAVPFRRHVPRLKALGVRGVVTLNEPFETFVTSSVYQRHDIEHLEIPTTDYAFAPSLEDICKALNFINRNILQGNSTYVHCKAGRGRSTTVVQCYLIKYKNMDPEEAWDYTKKIRPRVSLTSDQKKVVTLFNERNLAGNLPIQVQNSVGVVTRRRPNARRIQPKP